MNSASFQGLTITIGLVFGAATLGTWSVANRFLSLPLKLVASAIGRVYYRRASTERLGGGDVFRIYRKSILSVAVVSLPFFLVLFATAPAIFAWALGDEWRESGVFAQIMIPWMWLRLINSPTAQTVLVLGRNGTGLIVQLAVVLVAASSVGLAVAFAWHFTTLLIVLSASSAMLYAALILIYGHLIRADQTGQTQQ